MVRQELLLTGDKYFLLLFWRLCQVISTLFERSTPIEYNREEREKGISRCYLICKSFQKSSA